MLARCGRAAHICGANLFLRIVFPAAIAFFETFQFAILWFIWNKLQIRTRQRGNCSTLAGKSRGGTPFCRTLKIVFPKSRIFYKVIFRCNCFHWNRCKFFVCGWWLETLLLGKSLKSGSARLGHIPSLPGNGNCSWNLVSHYNLLILKAIAILPIFS